MAYKIKYQKQAVLDAARLQKDEPNAFKKLLKLEAELREHPRTGTGHPEQLRGDRSNQWSRHITQKHRLVALKSCYVNLDMINEVQPIEQRIRQIESQY